MSEDKDFNNNTPNNNDTNKVKYKINTHKKQLKAGEKVNENNDSKGKKLLFFSILAAILVVFVLVIILVIVKSNNSDKTTSTRRNTSTNNTDSSTDNSNIHPDKDNTTPQLTQQIEKLEFNANTTAELSMWFIADLVDEPMFVIYKKAIDEMKKDFPNITINWETYTTETYKSKIKTAIANNEVPDIFYCWSGSFLGDFVNTGKIYCLDDVLDKYIGNGLSEAMLDSSTFNGKHYGIPTAMNYVTLFANLDMLSKVGYDHIPSNKEQLFDCCDKLLSKGYIPFGCSFKENWCITAYLEPIIENTIGAEELYDVFRNEKTWNNDGIIQAIDTFQQMINRGYFDRDAFSLSNEETKANFMAGKYAFYQNGSWNCSDFSNTTKTSINIITGEWPAMTSRSIKKQFNGGPTDTLCVSASSKNATIAAEYATQLGKLISNYSYYYEISFPTWSIPIENDLLSSDSFDNNDNLFKTCVQLGLSADEFVLYGDYAMRANEANIYLTYVTQLCNNSINGIEFVAKLTQEIR
jgi:raffinose/stachyose/melibiose transport system substrate-binding protein